MTFSDKMKGTVQFHRERTAEQRLLQTNYSRDNNNNLLYFNMLHSTEKCVVL